MRTLFAAMLGILPLVQAQDSRLLTSVEPNYQKYSEDLASDFDAASASVTLTVLADGKPFALDRSSVPLPFAVVMALKDYEFRPQGAVPHGRPLTEGDKYQITLTVPIRQSKDVAPSPIRVRSGVSKGLLIKRVPPESSEYIRFNRIHGTVTLEAKIDQQGELASLKASHGAFALIESAYDAVRQWQWRSYFLNGHPVEVLTDIEVTF